MTYGGRLCVQELPLDRKLKRLYLVSVAQFRPEKNHALQLRAFALARQQAVAAAPSPAGAPLSWLAWNPVSPLVSTEPDQTNTPCRIREVIRRTCLQYAVLNLRMMLQTGLQAGCRGGR